MTAKVKMQLKRGTPVFQDFSFFRWPGRYTGSEDLWFDAEIEGENVTLKAHGFGILNGGNGAYGNGAIHVKVAHLHPLGDTGAPRG